jgi:N4-gp56 family major capsid protein
VGRDAYGIVALKGAFALTPMVVNPKPSDSDPLAQRGHVSWKGMQTAVILNDAFQIRVEVAARA